MANLFFLSSLRVIFFFLFEGKNNFPSYFGELWHILCYIWSSPSTSQEYTLTHVEKRKMKEIWFATDVKYAKESLAVPLNIE